MQTAFLKPLMETAPLLGSIPHGDAPDGRGRLAPGGYAISPIFFESPVEERQRCFAVPAGTRAWFRLTGFRPEAVEAILLTARGGGAWPLLAGRWRTDFQVRRWCGWPLGEAGRAKDWTGAESKESLRAKGEGAVGRQMDRLSLEFVTPTAFRKTGPERWNATTPLPIPAMVWGSLQRRWQETFPDEGETTWDAEFLGRVLALGRFEVRSAIMAFERHEGKVPGFIGEAEFQLHRDLSESQRVRLWMWSEFARYAGIGTMTAWGMGQARRKSLRD